MRQRPGPCRGEDPFSQALHEAREEKAAEAYPLARLGAPEDVAANAAFLASDAAAWVTGQVLTLDGGLLAGTDARRRAAGRY